MTDHSAVIEREEIDGRPCLAVRGSWTVSGAREIDSASIAFAHGGGVQDAACIEAGGIQDLDTFGCLALDKLRRTAAPGRALSVEGLPQKYQRLFDQISREADRQDGAPTKVTRNFDPPAFLGQAIEAAIGQIAIFCGVLGAIVTSLLRVVRSPPSFRLTSTTYQLDRIGWQAVPIVALITFLIGSIIAQQGFFHLRKFAADEYVVDLVGILVLREIGVLLVAIMVAGRSGSAYTAELGSMKMREEIDAIRTMGLDPVEVLVLPRVLALVIALPLLAFLGCMSALVGGGVTAWLYAGMSPEIYIARLKDAISIEHFQVGMIKAPFMALTIGVVAAMEGFAVRGSSESLGQRTTASVVKAIFLVIVLDGLFAVFFASIGM